MRSDSKRRNGRSDRSAVSDHALEPNDATIHKGDGLVRNLHGWREVRIVKGIVKRIAKDDEAMSMMGAKYANAAAPEAGIAPWPITVWPVTVAAVAVGSSCGVVDPGFSGIAAGVAVDLLSGSAPGKPNGISRHSGRNLALSDELLLARGQAIVKFGIL